MERSELEFFQFCRENGIKVLLLLRRNTVREAVSQLIADARNFYNITKTAAHRSGSAEVVKSMSKSVFIDPQKLVIQITAILAIADWSRRLLNEHDLQFLEIYYEDYLADREGFFGRIFDFLKVKGRGILQESDFMKVLPEDLSLVIDNYDEVKARLAEEGFSEGI